MTDPFHHMKRRVLTAHERAALFARCDGRCANCTRKLGPSDKWDADHILALERGGTNAADNWQVLCSWCHTPKTADDHAAAGHIRRANVRHVVPSEHRRSRSWGKR